MFKLFRGNVACPICDGYGLVYKAKLENLGLTIYVCDDCEAMWQNPEKISRENFKDFSTFLREHNCLSYTAAGIIDLGYDWYRAPRINELCTDETRAFLQNTFGKEPVGWKADLDRFIAKQGKDNLKFAIDYLSAFLNQDLSEQEKSEFILSNTKLNFVEMKISPIAWLKDVIVYVLAAFEARPNIDYFHS